jgi:hypothetical protein
VRVAKMNLFNAVNAGRVRILIGSTEKMGAGTNVQRRLRASHHLRGGDPILATSRTKKRMRWRWGMCRTRG